MAILPQMLYENVAAPPCGETSPINVSDNAITPAAVGINVDVKNKLQSHFNWCASNGYPCWLPPGGYGVTDTVVWTGRQGLKIQGAGGIDDTGSINQSRNTVIKAVGDMAGKPLLHLLGGSGTGIDGITLWSNGFDVGAGIKVEGSSSIGDGSLDAAFRDISTIGMDVGILAESAESIGSADKIVSNWFSKCSQAGFRANTTPAVNWHFDKPKSIFTPVLYDVVRGGNLSSLGGGGTSLGCLLQVWDTAGGPAQSGNRIQDFKIDKGEFGRTTHYYREMRGSDSAHGNNRHQVIFDNIMSGDNGSHVGTVSAAPNNNGDGTYDVVIDEPTANNTHIEMYLTPDPVKGADRFYNWLRFTNSAGTASHGVFEVVEKSSDDGQTPPRQIITYKIRVPSGNDYFGTPFDFGPGSPWYVVDGHPRFFQWDGGANLIVDKCRFEQNSIRAKRLAWMSSGSAGGGNWNSSAVFDKCSDIKATNGDAVEDNFFLFDPDRAGIAANTPNGGCFIHLPYIFDNFGGGPGNGPWSWSNPQVIPLPQSP